MARKKKSEPFVLGTETKPPEELTTKPFNVWNFIKDISFNKEYLLTDLNEKEYVPFIVNRNFAAHIDTFHDASLMNQYPFLDKKLQHDYMFYSIGKKKNRYKPWLKKTKEQIEHEELIKDIAKVLNYDIIKAKYFWGILNKDQQKDFLLTYVYPDSKNK